MITAPTLKQYFIDKKNDILRDVIGLVKAESPTLTKKLVDECGDILTSLIKERLDVQVTVHEQAERGNHLSFSIGKGKKRILILGHFDTVWEKGKLPIEVKENKLYGPGVLDMKSGVIQSVWAVKALKDENLLQDKEIVFLLTSDEEVGSQTSRELIEAEAKLSDIVLVMEPPVAKTGALKTGRKGVGIYQLRVKGKSTHAGNHHEDGRSAIKELAQQVLKLEGLTDYDKGTTINVGTINGGTRTNVVPDFAEATIDIRVRTMDEAKRIVKVVENLQPINPGVQVEIEGELNRPPLERTEAVVQLFEKVKDSAKELGIDVTEAQVGGASDGNFTGGLGIPTLDGLGCPGEGPHAENEHIIIDELPVRTALVAQLIRKL